MGPRQSSAPGLTRASAILSFGRRRAGALALTCALLLPARAAFALPTNAEAKAHLERGSELFKNGEFDAAIEEYRKGYAKEEDPVFLYAWAQAELRQEHCTPAVKLYKKYLETNPPEASAEAARSGILECADKLTDDDTPAPSTGPTTAPSEPAVETDDAPVDEPKPPREKRWSRDPLAASLTAVGIAGVGAGVGVLAAGIVEKNKAPATYGEFDTQQARARRMQIAGGVVLGVGAAVLVGGIVRFAILGSRAKKQRNGITAMLGRETVGVVLSGRF